MIASLRLFCGQELVFFQKPTAELLRCMRNWSQLNVPPVGNNEPLVRKQTQDGGSGGATVRNKVCHNCAD